MSLAEVQYSPDSMLRLGELARRSSPGRWAVQAVATVWPELGQDRIEAWPLGQLDNALVVLRERQFGNDWPSEPVCSACSATFEVRLDPAAMGFGIGPDWQPGALATREVDLGAGPVLIRPLIVHDLLALERCGSEELAQAYLEGALEVGAEHFGRALELASELDPLANVWIATECPECGAEQVLLFDPARFLAEEMARGSDRLLGEVADLARVYHWSEADILALSPSRRSFYLSRIGL